MNKSVFGAAIAAALTFALAAPAVANITTSVTVPTTRARAEFAPAASWVEVARREFFRKHVVHQAAGANFAYPIALALDTLGNLKVANFNSNIVQTVTPAYKVLSGGLTAGVNEPFSLAVDTDNNVYVGSAAGGILKFNAAGKQLGTITANASFPQGMAVDQFQDLFVTVHNSIAIDDVSGNSISSNIFTAQSQIYSIAIGGAMVYAFYAGFVNFGNGSYALRAGTLQFYSPILSQEELGSACADVKCWFDDSTANTLTVANPGTGTKNGINLSYQPFGIAVDAIRHRVYVADPTHNAVQVYNASTLALIHTIE